MKTVTCKIMDAVNEFKGEWNNDAGNYLHLNSIEGRYIFSFKEYLRAFKSPFTLVCSREEFNSRLFGMSANFGESSLKHLRIWQEGIKRQPETDGQHTDKLNEMDKELDVMDIDWSKAPEGTTHYGAETGAFHGGFYKIISSDEGFFYDNNQWLTCVSRQERLTERPQPVFTQAMADNRELPQVGMDCLFKKRGALEAGTVTAITKRFIIFTDSFGDEHVRKLDELTIEPIDTRTNKEKAIDDMVEHLTNEGVVTYSNIMLEILVEKFIGSKIHCVKWVGE
ncbi:MAG: hypothetical protein MJK15_05150 [Colwellia sp.]|nr:hypothetical protein [Colwellia sp.]